MIHPRSCPKFQIFFLPFPSPLPLWSPWMYQSHTFLFFPFKGSMQFPTWTVYIRLNISTISSTSISPKHLNIPWKHFVQANTNLNPSLIRPYRTSWRPIWVSPPGRHCWSCPWRSWTPWSRCCRPRPCRRSGTVAPWTVHQPLPELKWWMWLDDDKLRSGEGLRQVNVIISILICHIEVKTTFTLF